MLLCGNAPQPGTAVYLVGPKASGRGGRRFARCAAFGGAVRACGGRDAGRLLGGAEMIACGLCGASMGGGDVEYWQAEHPLTFDLPMASA